LKKINNKLFYSFFLLALTSIFYSCGTRDALFDVNAKTEIRIELGMNVVETHNFVKGSVGIPNNATISNLGLKAEDVSEILPLKAILKPKFGDEINLDFIHAVNIYIIDPVLLKRREIFYMDFIRGGEKTEIELLPTLVNVSDLVVNDRAIIEVSIELRQFPPSSFDMCVQMQFSGFASE
jgi:hypothetical protein